MKKIFYLIALVLLSAGFYVIADRTIFLQDAVLTTAEVVTLLPHEGPPRRPGSKEFNLRYTDTDGLTHNAIAETPFLGYVKSGDQIKLYIDPKHPDRFMFTSIAEILATPLTTLLFGVGFLIAARMAKSKAQQDSNLA